MPRVTKSFKPNKISAEESSAEEVVGQNPASAIPGARNDERSYGYRRYGNSGYSNGGRDYADSPPYRPGETGRDRDVPTEEVSGILEIMTEGHGFLRPKYIPSDADIYISASQIRRFWLRPGDLVEGAARPPKETERYFGLLQVNKVNGEDADKLVTDPSSQSSSGRTRQKRVRFEDLTAIYPNKHLKLETGKAPLSQRVIDLAAPIGFGQRGLVVSPPK